MYSGCLNFLDKKNSKVFLICLKYPAPQLMLLLISLISLLNIYFFKCYFIVEKYLLNQDLNFPNFTYSKNVYMSWGKKIINKFVEIYNS